MHSRYEPDYYVSLKPAAAIVALALVASSQPAPRKMRIAVAADLQFAMADLARDFRTAHPDIEVENVVGSSGNFYAEIVNGAPFDLFLSADTDYPRRLVQDKLAVSDSVFVYGTGHLVVWVPKGSPLDLPRLEMRALEAPSVKHIAIANPQHAPYGRAAEAALRSAGIYDEVSPKLVRGENIAQAFQFVESGSAEIGIVALSLALAPNAREQGRYWEVPAKLYAKLEQSGVILVHATNPQDARVFRSFLMTVAARRTLASYGFF